MFNFEANDSVLAPYGAAIFVAASAKIFPAPAERHDLKRIVPYGAGEFFGLFATNMAAPCGASVDARGLFAIAIADGAKCPLDSSSSWFGRFQTNV